MKRMLRLTLDIEIDDLPDADREELAKVGDTTADKLPRVEDVDSIDLADAVAVAIDAAAEDGELFAGTDVFANMTRFDLVSSEWLAPVESAAA